MIRDILIRLLFRLLGNGYRGKRDDIPYLFGATTMSKEARRKRWDKSLYRLYRDKNLLDYLFYLSEGDKENVFNGKVDKRLAQGARIRTLFLVYSARQVALKRNMHNPRVEPDDASEDGKELSSLASVYKKVTGVK